jgi:hypothetical protein
VAQGEVPEFKPQYLKKNFFKESLNYRSAGEVLGLPRQNLHPQTGVLRRKEGLGVKFSGRALVLHSIPSTAK